MSQGNPSTQIPIALIWLWFVVILSAVAATSSLHQENVKPVDKQSAVPADLPNTFTPGPNEKPAKHRETSILQSIISAPKFCPKGQRLAHGRCRYVLSKNLE